MSRNFIALIVIAQCVMPSFGQDKPKVEFGPVLTATTINYVLDYKLRFGGGRIIYYPTRGLGFEGSILTNFSVPSTVTARDGGRAVAAEFGPKLELWKFKNMDFFVKGGAGFLVFNRTLRGILAPDFRVATERKIYPTFDIGGGAEIAISRHIKLRGDLSDFVILYRQAEVQDDLAGVSSVLPSYSQHGAAISMSVLFHF